MAPNARFCPACGTAATESAPPAPANHDAPVAERRITSVLFADLVGFTPLSEARDAEEVRELLSSYFAECRTVIGRYGGTVEKFIGDAVMAVWGVPVAHEDDAERAVRAGLELVDAVAAMGESVGAPGLAMRVGVVTGEVAVTLGATAEGMVAGDAVNTAARVQAAAEPGQLWVDEATRHLTISAVSFVDRGEHSLKGKAGPVRLWQARAVMAEMGGGQRADGLEAPLAGRVHDLRLLKEIFHAAEETRRPRLVVLDGQAGVGKSRLAWEFEKYVDGLSADVRWHRGRCLSYGDGVAFWALAEAVRSRLGLVDADSTETFENRLDASLAELVPDPDERRWIQPRLAALVGTRTTGSYAREDLFAAWSTFLERVGAEDPVVLLVDDAQYADDGLLDFVDHVLGAISCGIFILALARPELLERRPGLGGRRATVIHLEPLDDEPMGQLIDGLVVDLPDTLRATLVERAEGVPLYAVETVRALIDRDIVIPRDGHYVVSDDAQLELADIGAPASLQALVAARLDALTSEQRRVVAAASVLGASFTHEGLAALVGESPGLDDTLAELRTREIIAVEQDRFSAERGQFRFVQGVVRQVALATQSKRDRKARHLAAADHLLTLKDEDDLAVVIAQHLLDACDASSSGDADIESLNARACDQLERAARRASALGAPAEARQLLEDALRRATDDDDTARLHLLAGEAASSAGDYRGAVGHADRARAAFDALGRGVDAGIAAGAQAYNLTMLSELSQAVELAEPRWDALQGVPGAERALIRLAQALGRAEGDLGHLDRSAFYQERRLMMAEADGNPEVLAQALINQGVSLMSRGAPVAAASLVETAADIARSHDLPVVLAHALNNVSSLLNSRDLPTALAASQEGLDVARRVGDSGFIDYTRFNLAVGLWFAGRLGLARKEVEQLKDTASVPLLRLAAAGLECRLADAMGGPLPTIPEYEQTHNEAELGGRADLGLWHALAASDHAGAARLAEESVTHAIAFAGIDDDFMWIWPPAVQAALTSGDLALAQRLMDPVDSASPGLVSAAVRAQWHYLRGLIAAARGDDSSEAERELRIGIEALGSFGCVGFSARAQEDLGHWLVGQRRAEEAASLLDRARTTYAEIGALGWLARLDARLEDTADALT